MENWERKRKWMLCECEKESQIKEWDNLLIYCCVLFNECAAGVFLRHMKKFLTLSDATKAGLSALCTKQITNF